MIFAVRPDPAWVAVALGEFNLPRFVSLPALKVVGEEHVLPAVRDPEDLVVQPDAVREAVARFELKLCVLLALASHEVVGEDAVRARSRVLDDPECSAVRPEAGGQVVVGVERFNVACHVPLKVHLRGNRRRRRSSTASTATTATAGSARDDDRRPRSDRDDHLEGRPATIPVVGVDHDGVRRHGGVQRRPLGHGDLARGFVDLKGRRIRAR